MSNLNNKKKLSFHAVGLVLASFWMLALSEAQAQGTTVLMANAGLAQTVDEGDMVTLNGSASTAPTGSTIATYTWAQTLPAAPMVSLNVTTPAMPTFTAPNLLSDTIFTFSLVVNDGSNNSTNTDNTVTITVTANNDAPTIDVDIMAAGEVLMASDSVAADQTITLDASGSTDPEGQTLTYLWAPAAGGPGTAITMTGEDTDTLSIDASTVTAAAALAFTLTVTDQGDLDAMPVIAAATVSSTVTINLVPASNMRPATMAGAPSSVMEGSTVTLNGSGTMDIDGDTITYAWTQTSPATPAVTLSDAAVASPTFTAPRLTASGNVIFTFTLVADDGVIRSADPMSATVMVTVTDIAPTAVIADPAPVFVADNADSPKAMVPVTLDGSGSSDPDMQDLSYTWTAVGASPVTLTGATTAMPSFMVSKANAGMLTFALVVNNGNTPSTAVTATVTVTANALPVAVAGSNQSEAEGNAVTLTGSSTDANSGQTLAYAWTAASTNPDGVTLSDADIAMPTFTAPNLLSDTEFVFSLVVNDGFDDSVPATVTVTVTADNDAPVIVLRVAGRAFMTSASVVGGQPIALDASRSTDPEGQDLTYAWVAAPANALTATLTGAATAMASFAAPTVTAATAFEFTLTVTDQGDADATPVIAAENSSSTITINVNPANDPPATKAATSTPSVMEGAMVSLSGSATTDVDGGGPTTYAWTQVPTEAPRVSLSSPTAVSTTFTAPEVNADTEFLFTLVADDGLIRPSTQPLVSATVTVTVTDAPPVAVIANPDPVLVADKAESPMVTVTLDGSGSTSPGVRRDLNYVWRALGANPVTLIDEDTAMPSFTATKDHIGNLTFTLVVNNGIRSSAAVTATVTVAANTPPAANAGAARSVAKGSMVTLTGSSTDTNSGQEFTYTWTQTSPATPMLSLNAVQGMPAMRTFMAPSNLLSNTGFVFSLVVNDEIDNSDPASVTITVTASNSPPVIALMLAGKSLVTNASVLGGQPITLDASGSTDPEGQDLTYAWVAAPANTPAVTLTGAATAMASFEALAVTTATALVFTLTVTDEGDADAMPVIPAAASSSTVTITVIAPNMPPATVATTSTPSVAEGDTVSLDGSGTTDTDMGGTVTYAWTQVSPAAPMVTLSDATVASPTFTAPEVTGETTFEFMLVADDGVIRPSTAPPIAATVTVTVTGDNDALTANAGAAQTVDEGATVTLDGSGSSDPEGQDLTYTWTQTSPAAPAVTLNDVEDMPAMQTFVAPELLGDTEFLFSLVVSDGADDSATATVAIMVENAGNDQPMVTVKLMVSGEEFMSSASVVAGQQIDLDASSSTDPEGQTLIYAWVVAAGNTPTVTLTGADTAMASFEAPTVTAATALAFTLTVTDQGDLDAMPVIAAATVSSTVTITVIAPNNPPISIAPSTLSVVEGSVARLDGSRTTDADGGGTITYAWTQMSPATPILPLSSANSASVIFTAPQVADNTVFVFRLVTDDGVVRPSSQPLITAFTRVTVTDAPPVAVIGDLGSVFVADGVGSPQAVVQAALDGSESTDPDNRPLTYAWRALGTNAVALSGADTATPTFLVDKTTTVGNTGTGMLTFALKVNNGIQDSVEVTATVTVVVNAASAAVIADLASNPGEGSMVTLDASGSSDSDSGQELTYTWTQVSPAAPMVSLDTTMPTMPTFMAPNLLSDTSFVFSLIINDGFDSSNTATVTITVSADNDEPVVTVKPMVAGRAFMTSASVVGGQQVDLDASSSTDPEGQPLIYAWVVAAGNTPTVTLTGADTAMASFEAPTVTAATALAFTLTVTDAGDADAMPVIPAATVSSTVTITVIAPNNPPATVAAVPSSTPIMEGSIVSLSALGTTDADGGGTITYTWTQVSPAAPMVTLPSSTTVVTTFTAPEVTGETPFEFTLVADDGVVRPATQSLVTSDPITVTITGDNDVPTADAGMDQMADEGDTVTLDASGSTDPEGQDLTYEWTSADTNLDGITLSSTDAAMPTFVVPNIGMSTDVVFTLQVNDGSMDSANTATVTIAITAEENAPTAVITSSATSAFIGDTITLNGSSSSDPEGIAIATYTWAQALPATPAVSLTVVAATPEMATFVAPNVTVPTELIFTLRVTDATGLADTEAITIAVAVFNDRTLNQAILPEIASVVLGDISKAIAGRVASAPSAANALSIGGRFGAANILSYQAQEYQRDSQLEIKDLLDQSNFTLSFNRAQGDYEQGEHCLSCSLTFWGSGSYRDIETKSNGVDIEGSLVSAQVGVDTGLTDNLLVGVLVNFSEGDFDYTQNNSQKGEYEFELNVINPYLALYLFDSRLNFWGSFGIGSGNFKARSNDVQIGSKLELESYTFGASATIAKIQSLDLKINAEITQSELTVESGTDVSKVGVDVDRFKIAFELLRNCTTSNGGSAQQSISAGLRSEGGDGNTDETGVEVAGYLKRSSSSGWTWEVNAYGLVDSEDHTEWGVGGLFGFNAHASREGLYFGLTPRYGHTQDELTELFGEADRLSERDRTTELKTELGYQMALSQNKGTLTPYSEMTLSAQANRYTLGVRWQPQDRLGFDLGGVRKDYHNGSDNRLLLKVNWRF